MHSCINKLYQQIEGIAMGCPLAQTMVNYILGHMETKMFQKQTPYRPKMYIRHIDDIFAVFNNDNACMPFPSNN